MARLLGVTFLVFAAWQSGTGAELEAYASLRQGLVVSDDGTDSELVFRDASSRFGLRGNENLDNGMTAFGRLEWGTDATLENVTPKVRLGYAGVSGKYGALSFGTQWSAWDSYIGGTHTRLVREGPWHSGPRRSSRIFKYTGNFRGVALETDLRFKPQDGPDSAGGLDEVQLALGYQAGGLNWQGAVIARDHTFEAGGTSVGFRVLYETRKRVRLSAAVANDEGFGAGGEEILGLKLTAGLSRGRNDYIAVYTSGGNGETGATPTSMALGFQHNLSARTKVALEMASVDPDIAGRDVTMEGGVLFRHDW